MGRWIGYVFAPLIVGIIVGGPLAYASQLHRNHRNFRVVKTGSVYRSGQLTQAGLERAIHDHGIKTVISLRDSYDASKPAPDLAEENYCLKQDIRYVRLSPKLWKAEQPGGEVPIDANIREFLKTMDDPTAYPVLIHCFAGVHRTGQMVAIYRMEYDRWTNTEALREMRETGYWMLDDHVDVHAYLESYKPRWWK